MTGIPDELVEKAARAMHILLDLNDRWDQMVGSDRESYREMVRPLLLAVGLPALLERVEAAEANDPARYWKERAESAEASRADWAAALKVQQAHSDALAAKVADVEALCKTAQMTYVGALSGSVTVASIRTALDAS